MKKLLIALSLTAGLAACGNLKNDLKDALKNRGAQVRESALAGSNAALEAYDLAQADDDAESYNEDDDTASIAGPQSAGAALAPETTLALAPGMAAADGLEITIVRYTCPALDQNNCRPETVTAKGDIKNKRGDIVGSIDATSTFDYYTSLADAVDGSTAGDKNATKLARDSYVRAEFNVTRTLNGRDDKTVTLVSTGHRVFSVKLGEWYVVETAVETTGFPARDDGKPSVSKTAFQRTFAAPDTTNTSGSSHRVVTFSDGTTDSTDRYAAYDRATDKLTGTWINTGHRGFVGNGAFDVKINQPFCRLDDVGTVTIDRTFGEAVTRVTSEHVDISIDNAVAKFEGTLTMADGTTRTKSLTRTQVSPAGCDATSDTREFTLTGTTYRGAEISLDVKRTQGNLTIDGQRTLKNGNVETLHAVRTDGVLNIDITVDDSAGAPVAEAHIVIGPDGSGEGEISRWIDGEKVTRQFVIENGRAFLKDGTKQEEVAVTE